MLQCVRLSVVKITLPRYVPSGKRSGAEDIRRTFRHKHGQTNVIEVNHWAKFANKTANIIIIIIIIIIVQIVQYEQTTQCIENSTKLMYKTAVYIYASQRRRYTSKTANIKMVILLSSTLTLRQCTIMYCI